MNERYRLPVVAAVALVAVVVVVVAVAAFGSMGSSAPSASSTPARTTVRNRDSGADADRSSLES